MNDRRLWAAARGLLGGLLPCLVLLAAATGAPPARAEFVSPPDATLLQSRALFNRTLREWNVIVQVRNDGASPIEGRVRVVVPSSNLPLKGTDGSTAAGEPFYLLSDDPGFALPPGAVSGRVVLRFALGGRVRPAFTTRVGVEPPSPPPPPGDTIPPVVSISSPPDGAILGASPVLVTGEVDDPGAAVLVNGVAATLAPLPAGGAGFSAEVPLSEGPNTLTATATDPAGNAASSTVNVTLDTLPPEPAVTAPDDGALVGSSPLAVTVTVTDATPVTVTIGGVPAAPGPGGTFTASVPLVEGPNDVAVVAIDGAGNVGEASLQVVLDTTAPLLDVAAPAPGSVLGTPTVTVEGTVEDLSPVVVSVNGVSGSVVGMQFQVPGVPLDPGSNTLEVLARDALGHETRVPLVVTFDDTGAGDTTAPVVSISSPPEGAVLAASPVLVTGTVDDPDAAVQVNGVPAPAAGGEFAVSVPLSEGENTLVARAVDPAGNVGRAERTVRLEATGAPDTDAPVVEITSPLQGAVLASGTVTVEGTVNDGTATVEVNGVGAPVVAGAFSAVVTLGPGPNLITAVATDPAGNSSAASVAVTVDLTGGVTDAIAPLVRIERPADGAFLTSSPATVSGVVDDPGASLVVNGTPVTPDPEGRFALAVPLTEGANRILARATDPAGNVGTDVVEVLLDTVVPEVTITTPGEGEAVVESSITVQGTLSDDDPGSVRVTVNGVEAVVTGGTFTATGIPLAPGANVISVVAADRAGNRGLASARVTLNAALAGGGVSGPAPTVAITSPAPQSIFSVPVIDVEGTVDNPDPAGVLAGVRVNGVEATVTGGTFRAEDVPLPEGGHLLTAVATNTNGATSTAAIEVTRDTTPPRVTIAAPGNGARLPSTQVTVVGRVTDIVGGKMTEEKLAVEVNGRPATVNNGTWEVRDLLLVRGSNRIEAVATDAAGNRSRTSSTVEVLPATGQQKILIVSGNNQEGVAGTGLPRPLVVEVQDADGAVIPDLPVTFRVRNGDGILTAAPVRDREVTVRTDEFGRASVLFQLGGRAGAGNHQVAVEATGFVGEVVFCESALPASPTNLTLVAGANQKGVAGQALPHPLTVLVTDDFGNVVPGVDVRFTIDHDLDPAAFTEEELVAQIGSVNGASTALVTTDPDGRASAVFTLRPQAGINNNQVVATIDGMDEPRVVFTASGLEPSGNAAATSVSGVVLDMQERPIPGATAKIVGRDDLVATTDENGRFLITGVPVDTVVLLVDGSTSPRQEELGVRYPFLAYQLTTLPGQDNGVGMPIQLPALNETNAKTASRTEDVVLTMPGVPGVEYTVFADSATLDGKPYTGALFLEQVNADKVPMPPPNGSSPALFATLQPAGIHFDPPVRVKVPNTDGLAPGTVVELFSFDHDIEEFVIAGTGHVTEDGAFVVSDPGFGIVKSGWHGATPPPPPPICKVFCDDKNECTSDRKLDPPCKCENKPANQGGACGDTGSGTPPVGKNSCVMNGECLNGLCIGEQKPKGSSCNDGLFCTENDQCGPLGCKGTPKKVDQPRVNPVKFELASVKKVVEVPNAILRFFSIDFRIPNPDISFERDVKRGCCEQKEGLTTEEKKIQGTLKIKEWKTPSIPLGTPPWVGDYGFSFAGRRFELVYGAFLQMSSSLELAASNTTNTCVDQSCWAAVLKLGAGVGLTIGGAIANPALPFGGISEDFPCEDQDGDPSECALVQLTGTAKIGMSLSGTADCVALRYSLDHDGVTFDLELLLFEGMIIPGSSAVPGGPFSAQVKFGTTFTLLPPQNILKGGFAF